MIKLQSHPLSSSIRRISTLEPLNPVTETSPKDLQHQDRNVENARAMEKLTRCCGADPDVNTVQLRCGKAIKSYLFLSLSSDFVLLETAIGAAGMFNVAVLANIIVAVSGHWAAATLAAEPEPFPVVCFFFFWLP
jgi:hypothetical protein